MKTFFYFIMFVTIFILPISCQKEDVVIPVNDTDVLLQLSRIPLPTETEVKAKLAEQNTLKAANLAPVSVKIFNLLDYTYEVGIDKAVKKSLCLEVNSSGYFSRAFTLYQTFAIVNGKIDDTKYDLKVQTGCPFGKVIKIKDELNVTYFWYWAHLYMENGEEFGYFDPNDVFTESHRLEIYPIKGVTCEIQVGSNVQYGLGKNRYEIFSIPKIKEDWFIQNKDSKLDIEVGIKFNLAKESTLFLEIPKSHTLWNTWSGFWVESIFLYDKNGESLRLEVGSNDVTSSSKRIFPVPFELDKIQVAYRGESLYSSEGNIKTFNVSIDRVEDGKTYYRVSDQL